jgi:hypothetical protein
MNRSDLPIVSPCGVDWRGMKAVDVEKRFCDDCKKHVHDLSQMSRVEARALLAAPSTEGLCVRYLYDERGEILFADQPRLVPASRLLALKRMVAAATLAAAPLGLAACMGEPMPPLPPPTPMMGAVACPFPPPAATPSASASAVTPPAPPPPG